MFALLRSTKRIAGFAFLVGLCALLGLTSNSVNAQTAPDLGTAASFAVLGGSTVTNTGPSIVNGDLGVSPGNAITGFPPGSVIPPAAIHAADAVALQAQNDATSAYNDLAGQTPCTDLTDQDLGGLTLTEGVYCFSSSAQLTGTLTLDAQGNAAAVFVFQIVSTLTTASNSSIAVINSGSDCNVWMQVGSSATLGTTTSFAGNILALASITLMTGSNVSGRAIALTDAVTMDNNTVGSPACIPPPAPSPGLSLIKDDGGVTVAPGGSINYTLTFQNTGNVDLTGVTLTDVIPADTTFNVGASTPGWNCAVSPCTFDVGTLLAGASGSVVFNVTVNDPTSVTQISNTAIIMSGVTNATASDTTPVTIIAPTAVPTTAPTAVPNQPAPVQPTFTLTPSPTSVIIAPEIIGLPDAGGGEPQPTYWLNHQGQ